MSVEDLERRMHQKSEPNLKPSTPQNLHQRPNVQQPFPQQLAQSSKGQPFIVPHSNVPNDMQKNPNQRIPMGFPANMMVPPHMNVQASQMHPNLARAPPNVPMPINNFNVSAFLRIICLNIWWTNTESDLFFPFCLYVDYNVIGERNAYCDSNNADNTDASETNATVATNEPTTEYATANIGTASRTA